MAQTALKLVWKLGAGNSAAASGVAKIDAAVPSDSAMQRIAGVRRGRRPEILAFYSRPAAHPCSADIPTPRALASLQLAIGGGSCDLVRRSATASSPSTRGSSWEFAVLAGSGDGAKNIRGQRSLIAVEGRLSLASQPSWLHAADSENPSREQLDALAFRAWCPLSRLTALHSNAVPK